MGVSGTLEEMVADIAANYLNITFDDMDDTFDQMDMYGDLDAFLEEYYSLLVGLE